MVSNKSPHHLINREFFVAIYMLGFLSIATQIILLREFLSLFYGNELVIGLILANWMLLTGLGSYLGRYSINIKNKIAIAFQLLIVLILLPFLLVFLMYFLRDVVFLPGSMIDILEIFLGSFLVLLPFCLISGFVFTLLCHIVSEKSGANLISKSYAIESAGSIAGGIVFNLVLIWFFETFESLLFLIFLNLGVLFLITFRLHKKKVSLVISFLAIGFIILVIFVNPDRLSREFLYTGQNVKYYKSTPYGNIVMTENEGQKNFYENNLLLFSSNQPIKNEEFVHFPMLQHENPKNVLLLSMGVPGIIKEVLKYDVHSIDYVEINPWLIESLQKYSDIYKKEQLTLINQDAREYVESTQKKYDVVLIGVPEPNTVQLNRFYTLEFYHELKTILKSTGVISFGVSGSSNYLSDESVKLYSTLHKTLMEAFDYVEIIPGQSNYFIASDKPLNYSIARRVEERKLSTQYVNKYYIQDDLLERRSKTIHDQLRKNVMVNRDFQPYTYSLKIRQWLSQFRFNFWIPITILAVAGIYFLFVMHPVNRGMFIAGFAGASLELILLVAFQIFFGSVFQMVGIIVTVFMAGLAFGANYRYLFVPEIKIKSYYRLQYAMALFSFILPVLLLIFKKLNLPSLFIQIVFVLLMFVASSLVGMIFSMLSQLRLKKVVTIVSEIYSADLLGAAIGSFLVSIYLIPLLGLLNVCLLTGVIVLVVSFLSSWQFKA